MNIDLFCRGFMALAALLTGMAAYPGGPQMGPGHQMQPGQHQLQPGREMGPEQQLWDGPHQGGKGPGAAGPSASLSPADGPGPSASPGASPAAASTGELASERVCPGQSDPAKTASALACLTTNARLVHKLPVVKASAQLMTAATAKDQDMARCGYGHTACGRDPSYWVTHKGYTGHCSGENIAEGQKSPREVFADWMKSPGHRANILNKDYRDLGVAETNGPHGPLWTMELGGC